MFDDTMTPDDTLSDQYAINFLKNPIMEHIHVHSLLMISNSIQKYY